MKTVACNEYKSTYPLRLTVSVSLVDALASVLEDVLESVLVGVLVLALKYLQCESHTGSKLWVKAAHGY